MLDLFPLFILIIIITAIVHLTNAYFIGKLMQDIHSLEVIIYIQNKELLKLDPSYEDSLEDLIKDKP